MKRFVAVLMLFFGITASAAEQGYYAYADWSIYSFRNAPVDGSDAIRVGGGYRFNPYVGLEAGIVLISPVLWKNGIHISMSSEADKSLGVTSGQIAVIGSIPLTQKGALFGKVGWASTTLDYTYSAPGGVSGSGSATKNNPIFGFGWQYTPAQNSSFRLQYENVGKVKLTTNYSNPYSQSSSTSDIAIQAVSVGIGYNF